jgi:ABC-type protease/lipase transport system fused ATPase/permease subunit
VGIARAVFGKPRLIVLDEPNANLDEAGEAALLGMVRELKAGGAAVVVITHRTAVLPACDKLLLLRDGTVGAFGPRDEVLQQLRQAAEQAAKQAAGGARPAAAAGAAA